MKRTTFFLAAMFCLMSVSAYASLMDESFVVETSENDATDSLNRIAGTLDKGFISDEHAYRSEHHGPAGPFATHEDAYDVS